MSTTKLAQHFPCCGVTEYPASPHHWDHNIAKHLFCPDETAADRDRLSAHDEAIGQSQEVWLLRIILMVFTAAFMLGLHMTGAHVWQSAFAGCVVFVGLLFLFEHDPAKDADQ